MPRTLGVEEEFHLVDLRTRRLTARAPDLLERLSGNYVAELQRCVVETNSAVVDTLADLHADLAEHRRVLLGAAADLGIGVVAAGAVPLAVPAEMSVTATPRYRRMLSDYQLLAREQLICGSQVHVGIDDRDEAVAVAHRVSPHVPTLLALSASSPFWADGSDTGYASARTLVWQRWPTTGPAAPVQTAAEYDAMVDALVASGVITDGGMVYFDVRPARSAPTLELRVCDSCPSIDTIVLVAGIFRALVDREIDGLRAGVPVASPPPTLSRAALWRAARSGLEGDLVDVSGPVGRPAAQVVTDLVDALRPQLEANGDWETVSELARAQTLTGSSAARQRRALRRRGRLSDVVDQLIEETAGRRRDTASAVREDPTLLFGYHPHGVAPGFDEAVDRAGRPRALYAPMLQTAAGLGIATLRSREDDIEQQQRAESIVFRVSGQGRAQVFPLDVLPRIVTAEDWAMLTAGLGQRARALDAFLRDVYGARAIVGDGVVPAHVLDRAPGLRPTGRLAGDAVRAHISGTDLVRDGAGRWLVLEDNLRVPSGLAYALADRTLITEHMGELVPADGILDAHAAIGMLGDTLRAAAPPHCEGEPAVVLLSAGWEDSAWFEHTSLAERLDIPLVTPAELALRDGALVYCLGRRVHPVDVVYARMDEDMLLSSVGADGAPLRDGLQTALADGRLSVVNALGNGVGDDKSIYPYVPQMVSYYLGEEPIIAQVPTWVCAERAQRDHVLDHLAELVVKPIDGLGGTGVVIGPDAGEEELAARRRDLLATPERYVAQEVVALSTLPTFDGEGFHPHHVDLRVFTQLREGAAGVSAHVVPAALTRVAARGSRIVNSSSGGGSKDTWILAADPGGASWTPTDGLG